MDFVDLCAAAHKWTHVEFLLMWSRLPKAAWLKDSKVSDFT
jgi:hypothetical protein